MGQGESPGLLFLWTTSAYVDNLARMADSGVPFGVDASTVPLVEDLNAIPVGQALTVEVLLSGLVDGDNPTSMQLVCKADPNDSNIARTTIIVDITQSLVAAGVIVATADPLAWRGIFQLTRAQAVRLASRSTYTYSVIATVDRDGDDVTRMVQRGAISLALYPVEFDSPLADGTYFADGELHADGFED